MKILISGDWHLGVKVAGYDAHDDIVKAAQAVVQATFDGVDLFVHDGDLFHYPRPEPRENAAAIELLDAVGCPFIVIPGNHDAGKGGFLRVKDGRPVPRPDALEPLRKINFRSESRFPEAPGIVGVDLDGRGHVKFLIGGHVSDARAKHITDGELSAQAMIDELFKEAARTEGIAAGFTHLGAAGATVGSEGDYLVGGDLQMPMDIAKALPFPVVNGHVHRRQTMPPNVLLPGSIVPTDFSDKDGQKGYLILEV